MPPPPPTSAWPFLQSAWPLPFAHRGGAGHPEIAGLENTLLAFRHAVELGYTYLETDVHATSDGVLVAFHDPALDRVTNRAGNISELTADEVTQARVGGREPVLLLEDLFEALPQCRVNVDLKSEGSVALLAAYVDRFRLHDRVLVGSFSRRRLRAFRRLTHGQVATSAHPLEVAAFVLLPGRLARWLVRAPAALQIPRRRHGVEIASARVIRRAHAAGMQVHVWTIDDATKMRELLDRGVDGIVTDRTDVLKDVLQARGQWVASR